MSGRISTSVEAMLGTLTFISTLLTGDIIIDIIVGIVTYTLARLFWRYYGPRIVRFLDKFRE